MVGIYTKIGQNTSQAQNKIIGKKKCCTCKISKLFTAFSRYKNSKDGYAHRCKACEKEWRLNNKEKLRKQSKEYASRPEIKEHIRKYQKKYREKNRERLRKQKRKYNIRRNYEMKMKVLEHYSNGTFRCLRCDFTDIRALTIDHIHGGGTKHRKQISTRFYKWLIDNNYPKGYRVLCFNCNWIERIKKMRSDMLYEP